MFAIVDIETCGGKFNQSRGRIIEICILKHDGLSVVDKLSSLVNPECYISSFYTNISGITNEMVQDAPKFYELAKDIISITQDCIFVAHNVNFDYSFVREEFDALGYKYRRDTLCTVRLSRKLIPGLKSYSLGNLCQQIGIEIHDRHRAEGDAVATAKLFDHLMHLKNSNPALKKAGLDDLMVRKKDKIKEYILKKLPESCGVYYFRNADNEIIYIGKSKNMYQRAQSHFNSELIKSRKLQQEVHSVDFVETGSEFIALILESTEIKRYKPKFNRLSKSDDFAMSIDWIHDSNGVPILSITPTETAQNPLRLFPTHLKARMYLEKLIEEYELCPSFCGIQSYGEACFNVQIKKCRGICIGTESLEDYIKRTEILRKKHQYQHPNFVIYDKGRHHDEKGFIIINQNRYAGFGYIDADTAVRSIEELEEFVSHRNYYPDIDELLRSLEKNRKFRVNPF